MNLSEAGKLGALASKETQKRIFLLRKENYEKNPSKCESCFCSLSYRKRKGKFCSQSCSAKKNNLGVTRWAKIRICTTCKEEFSKYNVPSGNCRKCVKPFGKRISFNELKSDHSKKTRLLKENGWSCEECNTSIWRGKLVPLEIDHIDGNPDNGKRENLRLLCSNCHAQTPTYKGRNKHRIDKSDRQNNRKRYYKNASN